MERENELLQELKLEMQEKNEMLRKEIEVLKAKENLVSPSFSSVVNTSTQRILPGKPVFESLPCLLVAAREDQKKAEATDEVKQTISTQKQIYAENIKTKHNGTAVVKFRNTEELEKAQTILREKLYKDFIVWKPKLDKPKIKIVGIQDVEYTRDQLKEEIFSKNLDTGDSFDILHTYINKFKKTLSVIAEVSAPTYTKIMGSLRIYLRWQKCKVYDDMDINRCFKCSRYGHNNSGGKCKNTQSCKFCAGEHDAKDCPSRADKGKHTCTNCKYVCEKYREKVNFNHAADDTKCCTFYKRLLKSRIAKTDYPNGPTTLSCEGLG